MGTNITDAPSAPDFKVFEGESTADGYQALVAQHWNGPWVSLGSGMGEATFDLHGSSLTSARFVKIVDDGTGSATENHPGADIDAVQNLAPELTNLPPDTPETPVGPTNGVTYLSYTYEAVAPVDPDGSLVYLRFFFGDNLSDWLGPYSPGQHVNASHIWITTGVYDVTAQAKDLNGSVSVPSDPLMVTIDEQPQFLITAMHGGFGLTLTVTNQGDQNLTNVGWSTSFSGMIFIMKGTSGHISALPAGTNATVHTGIIVGLGKTDISITIGDVHDQASGFLLGPILFRVKS
jgi:hypothetical protein